LIKQLPPSLVEESHLTTRKRNPFSEVEACGIDPGIEEFLQHEIINMKNFLTLGYILRVFTFHHENFQSNRHTRSSVIRDMYGNIIFSISLKTHKMDIFTVLPVFTFVFIAYLIIIGIITVLSPILIPFVGYE